VHATACSAFRSVANLSIASYSRRPKDISSSNYFFPYDLPFSRYRCAKSSLISGAAQNFAIISAMPQQRLFVRYRFYTWQLRRSNGGVAPTVTSDDLDLLLWHWHTLNEKFSKGKISETTTDTATLSCHVTQLDMILQGTPNYDRDLCKKGEMPWSTLQLSGSNMPRNLPRTFRSYFGDGRSEGAAAVSAFWPTLTYFCDCDTQLNETSEIIHTSKL